MTGCQHKLCLVTDCYGAYNDYAGPQQRCWVHLVRDLHELKEEQGQHDTVQEWLHVHPDADQRERAALYQRLVQRAVMLGRCYAQEKHHPWRALAQRLVRHQDELFQFVVRAGVRGTIMAHLKLPYPNGEQLQAIRDLDTHDGTVYNLAIMKSGGNRCCT